MTSENSSPGVNDLQQNSGCESWPSRWHFKRNCALSPSQLLKWYLGLAALSLTVAVGFLAVGYWMVLPFTGLELLVLAVAFVAYGRHAADYEAIELAPGALKLVVSEGPKRIELEFAPQWTKLHYDGRHRAPLVFSSKGRQAKIGRFVAEKDKPELLREIRAAMAQATSLRCG